MKNFMKNFMKTFIIFFNIVLVFLTITHLKTIKNLRHEVNERGIKIHQYEENATSVPVEPEKDDVDTEKLKAKNNALAKDVSNLEATNKDLEEQVSILEEENVTLKKENAKLGLQKSTPNYLRIKFWYDGKNYEILNEDIKLYKNAYLSKPAPAGKVIIVSPTISEDRLENGQTVYTVMSNKGLIFMSSYPSLTELEGSYLKAPESAFSDKENKKYLSLIFWQGDYEKMLYQDSNQSWYSDCYLSEKVEDSTSIVIVSENNDSFDMSNKVTIYSAFTQDGKVVWMSQYPNLEIIQ